MMKYLILAFFCAACSISKIEAQCNISIDSIKSIAKYKDVKEFSVIQAGKAWVFNKKQSESVSENKTISVLFDREYCKTYGSYKSIYFSGSIQNNTAVDISLLRLDDVIANLKEFFYINNEWVEFKPRPMMICGNSAWCQIVPSKNKIQFMLEAGYYVFGSVNVPYKITVEIEKKIYDSNIICALLSEEQIDFIWAKK